MYNKKKPIKKSTLPEAALFFGLGSAAMAKDSFEEFLSYFVKQGKMAVKDQAKLRREIKKRGEKEYKILMCGMNKSVNTSLKAMNMPTRKEFEALKKKVGGKKKSARKSKPEKRK